MDQERTFLFYIIPSVQVNEFCFKLTAKSTRGLQELVGNIGSQIVPRYSEYRTRQEKINTVNRLKKKLCDKGCCS